MNFQHEIQARVREHESVILVAPTGLGKTLAVTGDLKKHPCKTVYAVPLRALCGGIKKEIDRRVDHAIDPRIHHGDLQESVLFGEKFIVTTYDQVVCGVPGLPLSLPLKAGHAVAGALLMSRLILDEVHLAWGISEQALPILLGIIEFRRKYRLQTILVTATLPDVVADALRGFVDHVAVLGVGEYSDDEELKSREANRKVFIRKLQLKQRNASGGKALDYSGFDEKLRSAPFKRIYFGNTVERLQDTFDRLVGDGMDASAIVVLHNRMPRSRRILAEALAHERFGNPSEDGDWLLLTNQVAEAGLDISAPLVISDPAPVDTLVQRAGRCARWFRDQPTGGVFEILDVPVGHLRGWSFPYRGQLVLSALKNIPADGLLTWEAERRWINIAWGVGDESKDPAGEQREHIETALAQASFALNLFDRASQHQRPGEIAEVFREILSIEVAVEGTESPRNLQNLLDGGQRPETSSVSLGKAWDLSRAAKGEGQVLRYEEGELVVCNADFLQPGDILVVPSKVAYLDSMKGLCFGDAAEHSNNGDFVSRWESVSGNQALPLEGGRRQTLLEHVERVMEGTARRLGERGCYRRTLLRILGVLEPGREAELADVVSQIATLAAAFHDLGKAGQKWQDKARKIDPGCSSELIGRTGVLTRRRIGVAHTPPAYAAIVRACELLMGPLGPAEQLIRVIALAAVRHHSSFMNPALIKNYTFDPHPGAKEFVGKLIEILGGQGMDGAADSILAAAQTIPRRREVPLALPNDDLFPIYALVGRALMLADREDAASGKELEQWQ